MFIDVIPVDYVVKKSRKPHKYVYVGIEDINNQPSLLSILYFIYPYEIPQQVLVFCL